MATTTLTGTQLPLDAASILNMLLGNQLTQRSQDVTQRGQDISWLSDLLSNMTTQRGQDTQLTISNAQVQAQLKGVYADYMAKGMAARAQYARDVATVGLEQARLNYEQRLADANLMLQTQAQKLQDVQQGYQQRQGAADTKMSALKMLADRSGPQDMFKYARLLGGLGTPVEMGQTVDPTKFADNLVDFRYRDSNKDSGLVQQPSSVNQPVDVLSSMPKQLDWPDLAGFLSMGAIQGPAATDFGQLALPGRIAQLGNVNGGGTGTGGGGDFWSDPGLLKTQGVWPGPVTVTNNQSAPNAGDNSNIIGLPYSVTAGLKSGQGGLFTTGYGADTAGSDWDPGLKVSDPATGKVFGAGDTVPKGMPVWVTRLAKGTGMDMQAVMALLASLKGQGGGDMAPQGMTTDPAMITGDAPLSQAPDAGGAKPEMVLNPTGAPVGVLNAKDTAELLRLLMKLHGGEEGGEPSQNVGEETSEPLPRKAKGTKKKGKSVIDMIRYADGSYGMSDLPTYTMYDPTMYGSLPFIQKLMGRQQSAPFSGFGQPLSNPTFGIFDMPDTLNLRDFYNLSDSEQQATKGVYQDALATNFNDILGRSRRAAPIGQTLGATRYAGATR